MNTPTTEAGLEVSARRDALLQAAIDFVGTLTGMEPPPIEVAPPEVFAPFHAFVTKVEEVILANSWCAHCGCGNDAADYAHAPLCQRDSAIAREAATRAEVEALRADVKRYCWLADRFLGADFRWNEDEESGHPGCQALVFAWPGGPVWGDLTLTLDAALSGLAATSVAKGQQS